MAGAGTERDTRNTSMVDLAQLAEIGTFMDRVFHGRAGPRQDGDAAAEDASALDDTTECEDDGVDVLLWKASKAIEILATRCEIVEHDLAEALLRAGESEQSGERWKSIAVELRVQAAFDRKAVDEWKARAEQAESRMAGLETEARQRVTAADARSTKLRGQVVAAFGHRSPIHAVLQSITLQEAAE
jgi:hypothetical protein